MAVTWFHESGGIVILEAKTIPMGNCKGHDKRLNDVISVVHTSNSALAYVKISSLIGCDTTPNCYTATSITIMWKVGCINVAPLGAAKPFVDHHRSPTWTVTRRIPHETTGLSSASDIA